MQTTNDKSNEEKISCTDEELHSQASDYINKSNHLIFHELPQVLSQIIKQEGWKKRTIAYKNFGEYALHQAPDGLGITNNDMLSLLKSAMNTTSQHAAHWAEVLGEVDTHVRTYAKEKKIPIREFQGDLTQCNTIHSEHSESLEENIITYLPSRSKSIDGQLLKLKKKDPQAYDEVLQGKIKINEVLPSSPRKKLLPIETVKNKFSNLSKSDRDAFLAWIEQEKAGE